MTPPMHSAVPFSWHQYIRQLRLYGSLSKGRLSFLVAMSALLGYLFASPAPLFSAALLLFIGGFLVSAGAGALNQWIERDYDKLMKRTQGRPLPTGQLGRVQVFWWAALSSSIGLLLLYIGTHPLVSLLALISLFLYVCVYTPLKRVGPIAVLVGSIPGAMPPLLGCVAAQATLAPEGILLFGIQFMWQFPHFWAIAWLAHTDYSRAGFKLLPGGRQDARAASHIFVYTLFLLPIGLLPTYFDMCGLPAAWIALCVGLLFSACALYLLFARTKKAAYNLMWASFLYLPFVQIAYVLYKL